MTRTGRPRTAGITRVAVGRQNARMSAAMLAEMKAEAERLERSLSFIAQLAWRIARGRMKAASAPHRGGP